VDEREAICISSFIKICPEALEFKYHTLSDGQNRSVLCAFSLCTSGKESLKFETLYVICLIHVEHHAEIKMIFKILEQNIQPHFVAHRYDFTLSLQLHTRQQSSTRVTMNAKLRIVKN
jgi:hypothetical protein